MLASAHCGASATAQWHRATQSARRTGDGLMRRAKKKRLFKNSRLFRIRNPEFFVE
jgi:hypothetical protein